MDSNFNGAEFRNSIQKSINNLNVNANILKEQGICVEYDELHEVPCGRFTVTRCGVRMESLFIPKENCKKLLVVLDGARTRKGRIVAVPKFDMWSWQKRLDINYLNIEDPMYFKYSDPILRIGWYYGDNEIDYREYIAELIKRICDILDIKPENLIIYGLSAGGTAAGFVAARIKGCTAVMNNPQIDFKNFKTIEQFLSITGNDIIYESSDGRRNDLISSLKAEKESNFLFMFNALSSSDVDFQLKILADSYRLSSPQIGINILSENVFAFIYTAKGCPSAHVTSPTQAIMRSIISTAFEIRKSNNIDDHIYERFLHINEAYYDYYLLKSETRTDNSQTEQKNNSISEKYSFMDLYVYARLDIKNYGRGCNLKIKNISDKYAAVVEPKWFSRNGIGHILKSKSGSISFELICVKSGRLEISLRGYDIRMKDGSRFPLYLDFVSLMINHENVLPDKKVSVCYEKPFKFTKNVFDGETVLIEAAWKPCDIRKL